eukprot:517681-Pelagomonas_calceolata.AAC.3
MPNEGGLFAGVAGTLPEAAWTALTTRHAVPSSKLALQSTGHAAALMLQPTKHTAASLVQAAADAAACVLDSMPNSLFWLLVLFKLQQLQRLILGLIYDLIECRFPRNAAGSAAQEGSPDPCHNQPFRDHIMSLSCCVMLCGFQSSDTAGSAAQEGSPGSCHD